MRNIFERIAKKFAQAAIKLGMQYYKEKKSDEELIELLQDAFPDKVVKKKDGKIIIEDRTSESEDVDTKNPTEEADIIINNFRNAVKEMAEEDYNLRWGGAYDHSYKQRSAQGSEAKASQVEMLVGYGNHIGGKLADWIAMLGKEKIAQNIQRNAETLYYYIEGLVFAIYDARYAKWGGGRFGEEMTIAILENIILQEG